MIVSVMTQYVLHVSAPQMHLLLITTTRFDRHIWYQLNKEVLITWSYVCNLRDLLEAKTNINILDIKILKSTLKSMFWDSEVQKVNIRA